MAMSCVSSGLIASGAECTYELERAAVLDGSGPLKTFAACTSTRSDCTSALMCASLNHGPDYCSAHPDNSCDGDVVVECDPTSTPDWAIDPPPVDCHAIGMTCLNAVCTDGKTCNTDIVSECIGNSLVGCAQTTKTEASIDCGLIYTGGTCGQVYAMPGCIPPESTRCIQDTGSYACQGSVLLGCANYLDGKLDCATIDAQCVEDTGVADCVANATDCTRSSPDRCNGGALEVCLNGQYQDFDCSSVGLGPCVTTQAGGAACGTSGSVPNDAGSG